MTPGLEEQIDDIIRHHPEAYFNGNHDLAVPVHALSTVITEIFAHYGVELIDESESEVMAAYIRDNEGPLDVTPSLLLHFILAGHGKNAEKALLSFSPRDYASHRFRLLEQRSTGGFKTDTRCPLSLPSSKTPTTRRPTHRQLTVENPEIFLGDDKELQVGSNSHLIIAGRSNTPFSSGCRVITSAEIRGESTGTNKRNHDASIHSIGPSQALERSWPHNIVHNEHSSTVQIAKLEREHGLDDQEFRSKSKRGQGVLQRVPRVSRTSHTRLREEYVSQTRTLLPDSRLQSDTSGYSADLSEDPLDPPSPGTENAVEDYDYYYDTLDSRRDPSPVLQLAPREAARAHRRDSAGLRLVKTNSKVRHQAQPSFPPSKSELEVEHFAHMQLTPSVGHDPEPSPPSNNLVGACPASTVLRRGVIPNLSQDIRNMIGPLKAGGSCDVYLGELEREDCSGTVERVAMKMLRMFGSGDQVTKAKKKFQREINLWLSLSHPHVLKFYGTYELDENRLCMVSPWAQGGNAMEYLRRNPTANRGRLLWQTSTALQYLHSGKDAPQIVHGDLKADNVLISVTGDALLCDFGLSRHIQEAISNSTSSSARVGGNIRFMAPELIVAPKSACCPTKTTPASDVFAFASLMLQIYTEKPPFCGLSEVQAMFKIASGELPSRPSDDIHLQRGMKNCLWALMVECWEFEAEDRPTMADISSRMIVLR